jgi:hypothetical protein
MLGHYEFKMLPFSDQAGYVWEHGVYLSCRFDGGSNINLYHVASFFVEVWYDPDANEIAKIRTFTSRACLEPYLLNIMLPGL